MGHFTLDYCYETSILAIFDTIILGPTLPRPEFRNFLNLAESRAELLPKWWSKAQRRECEIIATDGKSWSDINCAVEKSDIQLTVTWYHKYP
jgi:hypothetical protein